MMTLEILQTSPLSPSGYCFYCKHLLRGEKRMVPWQAWRYGKQKKKMKANHTIWFNAHPEGLCIL